MFAVAGERVNAFGQIRTTMYAPLTDVAFGHTYRSPVRLSVVVTRRPHAYADRLSDTAYRGQWARTFRAPLFPPIRRVTRRPSAWVRCTGGECFVAGPHLHSLVGRVVRRDYLD